MNVNKRSVIMNEKVDRFTQSIYDQIDNLTHIEMARLWRHAPEGHIFFDTSRPFAVYF